MLLSIFTLRQILLAVYHASVDLEMQQCIGLIIASYSPCIFGFVSHELNSPVPVSDKAIFCFFLLFFPLQ